MVEESRTRQRDQLMFELGLLVAPIRELINSGEDWKPKISIIEASIAPIKTKFIQQVGAYCNIGVTYMAHEHQSVNSAVVVLLEVFKKMRIRPFSLDTNSGLNRYVDSRTTNIAEAIAAIPCEIDPTTIPKGSPFQAYCELRSICARATTQLEIFDPYCGDDVFYRYLYNIPTAVQIVIVTGRKMLKNELLSVSQLFAQERSTTYRLIENNTLHDRHIRVDGDILQCGGSLKDAGKKSDYSIAPVQNAASTATALDQLIATGVEWFGPTQTTHKT